MNKRTFLDIDWGLLTPVLILLILGLTTIFTININLFKSQLIFSIISIFVFFFFSKINYHTIKQYDFIIYVSSILLLLLVLIIGIESRGSVRWFEFLGFRVQFSELIKPFLIFSFASFLSSQDKKSFKNFILNLVFLFPIALLIFLQPDLGNALVFVFVVFLVLFNLGFSIRFFILSFLFFLSMLPIIWNFLHGYQRERLITFLNLKSDPLGTSYNAIQAIIAIGSGSLFGRGLGQGTQSILRFLPERHTDFIFSTLSEALGFFGALIVIGAFIFLLAKIHSIYNQSDDYFCKLVAVSSFFLIFVQFSINIGMNLGVLPIVGITLPFVSYGGSSLLSNFILLGFLSSIVKTSSNREILEIR
ncbi:MAG: FtsW/RodA/SpoVE family cell cycle protein [Candidatus Levybacteria bacterium]|nr:FtsW/RodA/SpoVE family cell cycle protein [Candidatus Levybacteria bacterium]